MPRVDMLLQLILAVQWAISRDKSIHHLPTAVKRCVLSTHAYLVAHPTARKWVITPVISGLTLLIPFITGVITHLLSGMSHQVSLVKA